MWSRRRSRHTKSVQTDLGVTPFMNLMAVLIPFLLSVAVFTRLAVLEIYLPPPTDEPPPSPQELKEKLTLTVTITERGLIVANGTQILSFIAPGEKGPDLESLSRVLQELKNRYPLEENAIVLSKAQIPYGTLVSVMDATRASVKSDAARKRTLFPNISLGEVE